MLTLNAADLSPYTGNDAPYSTIAGAGSGLGTFRLGAVASPSLQQIALEVTTGGAELQTFDLPLGAARVSQVSYGSEIYSPAVNPASLQPGEFVFDSLNLQVTIAPLSPLMVGRSLSVQSIDPGNVLVEYLMSASDALPDMFFKYNLTGALAWSCGWEENPTGSFELITDWATADQIENELIPQETELEIYGVGFQVASLVIVKTSPLENPNLEARVSVQLRGKWESYLEDQVIIDSPNGIAAGARTIRGNTTVQAIAQKVGAVVNLPTNRIKAPTKAGEETKVSLQEVFEGHLRHNGCFARYSSAAAIEAVPLAAVATHQVSYTDLFNQRLKIAVNAKPRAFDYKNNRLEWGEQVSINSGIAEDTQGSRDVLLYPQWRLKFADKRIEPVGSPNPEIPPDDLQNALDTSLVFDGGGPIKELTTTWTENGAVVKQSYVKYGVVAIAYRDLYYRVSTGWYKVEPLNPAAYWQLVEQWEANYFYDHSTGYFSGHQCEGSRLLRLKSESKNESCQAYDDWFKSTGQDRPKKRKQLDFFNFQWKPLIEKSSFQLDTFRNHYKGMPPRPTEEAELFFPEFKPDGSRASSFVSSAFGQVVVTREDVDGEPWIRIKYPVPVPGWVEPRFAVTEISQKSCFIREPDPDNSQANPLPDLIAGEYKDLERRLNVPDYRYQSTSGTVETETFIEYTRLQTQKEIAFARSAKETDEQIQKGRPNEHTRKEKLYEKIDPLEGEADPDEWEYSISTTAAEDDRLVGDTLSYPYASTYAQAVVGLETELEINNTRDTKTTSLELKHSLSTREGDLVNLEGHGQFRVLGYAKSLAILGKGLIQPGRMSLDLGSRIAGTQITIVKTAKPKPAEDSEAEVVEPLNSGQLIANYPGRGNRG